MQQKKKVVKKVATNQEKKPVKKKRKVKKKNKALYVIIIILAMIIAILLLRTCSSKDKKDASYEDSVSMSYEPNADINVDDTRLNLAIMPDYVVTKDKPEVLIPYPEQNAYDIDVTFCDPMTDQILYQSKLIRPGSIIACPAYNFAFDGNHKYRVEIRAYDKSSHELIDDAVAMEAEILKK